MKSSLIALLFIILMSGSGLVLSDIKCPPGEWACKGSLTQDGKVLTIKGSFERGFRSKSFIEAQIYTSDGKSTFSCAQTKHHEVWYNQEHTFRVDLAKCNVYGDVRSKVSGGPFGMIGNISDYTRSSVLAVKPVVELDAIKSVAVGDPITVAGRIFAYDPASGGANFNYHISREGRGHGNWHTTLKLAFISSDGKFSFTIPSDGLEGDYKVSVWAQDPAFRYAEGSFTENQNVTIAKKIKQHTVEAQATGETSEGKDVEVRLELKGHEEGDEYEIYAKAPNIPGYEGAAGAEIGKYKGRGSKPIKMPKTKTLKIGVYEIYLWAKNTRTGATGDLSVRNGWSEKITFKVGQSITVQLNAISDVFEGDTVSITGTVIGGFTPGWYSFNGQLYDSGGVYLSSHTNRIEVDHTGRFKFPLSGSLSQANYSFDVYLERYSPSSSPQSFAVIPRLPPLAIELGDVQAATEPWNDVSEVADFEDVDNTDLVVTVTGDDSYIKLRGRLVGFRSGFHELEYGIFDSSGGYVVTPRRPSELFISSSGDFVASLSSLNLKLGRYHIKLLSVQDPVKGGVYVQSNAKHFELPSPNVTLVKPTLMTTGLTTNVLPFGTTFEYVVTLPAHPEELKEVNLNFDLPSGLERNGPLRVVKSTLKAYNSWDASHLTLLASGQNLPPNTQVQVHVPVKVNTTSAQSASSRVNVSAGNAVASVPSDPHALQLIPSINPTSVTFTTLNELKLVGADLNSMTGKIVLVGLHDGSGTVVKQAVLDLRTGVATFTGMLYDTAYSKVELKLGSDWGTALKLGEFAGSVKTPTGPTVTLNAIASVGENDPLVVTGEIVKVQPGGYKFDYFIVPKNGTGGAAKPIAGVVDSLGKFSLTLPHGQSLGAHQINLKVTELQTSHPIQLPLKPFTVLPTAAQALNPFTVTALTSGPDLIDRDTSGGLSVGDSFFYKVHLKAQYDVDDLNIELTLPKGVVRDTGEVLDVTTGRRDAVNRTWNGTAEKLLVSGASLAAGTVLEFRVPIKVQPGTATEIPALTLSAWDDAGLTVVGGKSQAVMATSLPIPLSIPANTAFERVSLQVLDWKDVDRSGGKNAGDTLRYRLTLKVGKVGLRGVQLAYELPVGLTRQSAEVTSGSGASGVTLNSGWTGRSGAAGHLLGANARLKAGEQLVLDIPLVLGATTPAVKELLSRIKVSATNMTGLLETSDLLELQQSGLPAEVAFRSLTLNPVVGTVPVGGLYPGATFDYVIQLTVGDWELKNAQLVFNLPEGLKKAGSLQLLKPLSGRALSTGWSSVGNVLSAGTDLQPGDKLEIVVPVKLDDNATGSYRLSQVHATAMNVVGSKRVEDRVEVNGVVDPASQTGLLLEVSAPEEAAPGDTMTYTIKYFNRSVEPIEELQIEQRVPLHTRFLSAACGKPPVDPLGRAPLACSVKRSPKTADKDLPEDERRLIIWRFEQALQPNLSGEVSFKVILNQ